MTTLNDFNLEAEKTADLGEKANFVDLDATTAGTSEVEALGPQDGGIGCRKFDFLSTS